MTSRLTATGTMPIVGYAHPRGGRWWHLIARIDFGGTVTVYCERGTMDGRVVKVVHDRKQAGAIICDDCVEAWKRETKYERMRAAGVPEHVIARTMGGAQIASLTIGEDTDEAGL